MSVPSRTPSPSRTPLRPRVRLALLLALLTVSCAYFNALYNARRLYDEAEAASRRGDRAAAERAHEESLEKAAHSFRSDPDGRWADDALLLVAQNHFALGNCAPARTALERLTRRSEDRELLSRAAVYLGAAEVCLGEAESALPHLHAAVEATQPGTPTAALARLWRARALFETGADSAAWVDLDAISGRRDPLGREAQLERLARAAASDRPAAAVDAFHRLLRDDQADALADTLLVLARAVGDRWGATTAREALDPAPGAPWPVLVRDRFEIERARQAALAGDTATAMRELRSIAGGSTAATANRARLILADVILSAATTHAQIEEVRSTLLPAIADPAARPIVEAVGVVGALLEQAQRGQPLAFFGAAEIARDELGAFPFARRLFRTYADLVPDAPWATKALLAALALDPPPEEARELRARIAAAGDPYALAVRGAAAPAYEVSEERLGRALGPMLSAARATVAQRDVNVRQVISELDSVAAVARADSVALSCGTMLDSMGVGGIRRDSVWAACLRRDAQLVDSFLAVDTLLLRDSVAVEEEREAEAEGDRPPQQPQEPQFE